MSTPVRLRPVPLTPHWPEEKLAARERLEPRSYARGFKLLAYADDELSFPDYPKCAVPGVSIGDVQRSTWMTFMGVDLSSKKRPGNAIVTLKVDPVSRRRYPIDIRFGAWKANETCQHINDLNAAYNPHVIMVEDNGYQAAIIEMAQGFKESFPWWMKVEPTTTGANKHDKEMGLPILQTEFAAGAWVFPLSEWEGATPQDHGQRGMWARLDYELKNHPMAATSDGVMALWFARQGIERFAPYLLQVQSIGDINMR